MTRPARHAVCTACGLTPFVCVIQRGAHFPYCPLCYYFTAMIPPLHADFIPCDKHLAVLKEQEDK